MSRAITFSNVKLRDFPQRVTLVQVDQEISIGVPNDSLIPLQDADLTARDERFVKAIFEVNEFKMFPEVQ